MTTFADLTSQLRVPVLASPMFIISTPDLVIAAVHLWDHRSSFPALNARPQSALRDWLKLITVAREDHDREHPDNPSAPFAVNLIVHRSNNRLEEDLATIAEFEVPIVITSLGRSHRHQRRRHAYGGIVLHDVIDDRFARKAIEKGADGLIAVAAGAGGHAGSSRRLP